MIKKHYIDTEFGQVHVRTLRLEERGDERPLVLLHPMPYSSLYYTTIMPLIEGGRTIVAVDYPGCGGSDALDTTPTIEVYAKATLQALQGLGIQGQCDFLGFHTGCLVATEIAVSSPEWVSSTILIDIPFFDEDKSKSLTESLTSHKSITEDLSCLQQHWDADVKTRAGIVPILRAFELFVNHMAAEGDGADGFRAAFSYQAKEKFETVTAPTLVIATKSSLYEGSLAAAELIQGSELIEMLDITRVVFEEGAEKIAAAVNSWKQ